MISGEAYLIELGIHLRQMREKRNLSQQSFAYMSDLPKSTIARIERAEINTSIKTLIKIANALEVNPKELLDFDIKQFYNRLFFFQYSLSLIAYSFGVIFM